MTSNPLIIVHLDTETTGLDVKTESFVQLGAVGQTDRLTFIAFNSFAYPKAKMSQGAADVHGITEERYQFAPSEVMVMKQFMGVLDMLSDKFDVIVSGFNTLNYDLPLLKNTTKIDVTQEYQHFDLRQLCMRRPEMLTQGGKLEQIFNSYCDRNAVSAHDAVADCLMCAAILERFMADQQWTLLDVLSYMAKPVFIDIMPFGKHQGCRLGKEDHPDRKDPNITFVPSGYIGWMLANIPDLYPDLQYTFETIVRR